MKLLFFQPSLLAAPTVRVPALAAVAAEAAPSTTPFSLVATFLAGALICATASSFYLMLIHPASARFEEQWQLGFALALLAGLQATAATLHCLRPPRRTADGLNASV
ncbi:MAG: hypothetical protein JSR82_07765 [Verrucomicrobia bacterium]|nr:hypothetical protein [Verrucomicrobiota bacterium]